MKANFAVSGKNDTNFVLRIPLTVAESAIA